MLVLNLLIILFPSNELQMIACICIFDGAYNILALLQFITEFNILSVNTLTPKWNVYFHLKLSWSLFLGVQLASHHWLR